jgi:sulfide:quinone oxidoreductase
MRLPAIHRGKPAIRARRDPDDDVPPAAQTRGMPSSPFRVVIAGGGVAALEAVLAFQELDPDHALSVEVIAPDTRFVYRPLSVRDPFGPRSTRAYDLEPLVQQAGASFRHGQVAAIDPDDRLVTLGDGSALMYDALLLATGVARQPALPGVGTFVGPADVPAFKSFAESLCRGAFHRAAFIVPPGPTWPLPIYELALQAGTRLQASGADAQLAIITPEPSALAMFGPIASRAVERALRDRGIAVHPDSRAESLSHGQLRLDMQGSVLVDAAWAAPRLVPRVPAGVPTAGGGFVPVDDAGRVDGFIDLFAAGDVTLGDVKQGGVAAQQAAVAAEAIAALAGIAETPEPGPVILRALLLTGGEPLWLRADPASETPSEASDEPLWWPAHKIFGKHLAPVLAGLESSAARV